MSIPKEPTKAKLVISFISNDKDLINMCIKRVEDEFSPADYVSPFLDFSHTEYYEDELGKALKRRFAAFSELLDRDALVNVKKFTNALEDETSGDKKRRINIDPGFLSVENFILATGKNFTHRVYLGDGIFADLTLIFCKGEFKDLPWTYLDYKESEIKDILMKIRSVNFL